MIYELVINKEVRIKTYLLIWNGFIGMTEKELEIMEKIISKYLDISIKVSDPQLINTLLFSSTSLKSIRESLGMRENMFNNYKASLKAKGVIKPVDNIYEIDPRLIPIDSITFKLRLG